MSAETTAQDDDIIKTRPSSSSSSDGGCGCCCRRRHRIAPLPGKYPGYEIIEVRPNRFLRIVRENPRERDEAFVTSYIEYLERQRRRHELRRKAREATLRAVEAAKNAKNGPSKVNIQEDFETQETSDVSGVEPEAGEREHEVTERDGEALGLGQDSLVLGTEPETLGLSEGDRLGRDNEAMDKDPDSLGKDTDVLGTGSGASPQTGELAQEEDGSNENKEDRLPDDIDDVPNHNSDSQSPQHNHNPDSLSPALSPQKSVPQNRPSFTSQQSNVTTRTRNSTAATLRNVDVNVGLANTLPLPSAVTSLPSREQSFISQCGASLDPDAVLFFFHGVGGSSTVWQAQVDFFRSQGYELVLMDMIGHGLSDAPDDPSAYEFREIALDALAVFDLHAKRKNVIIGHSYGCSFATVVARRRARYVNRLVLVSGGSPTPLAPQMGIFSLPLCLLLCCLPIIGRGFHKSAFYSTKTIANPSESFSVSGDALKYTMNGQNWLEGGWEYHALLNVPLLIIHGRQDKLVSIADEMEMERAVCGARLEIIDWASHMVMMERPEAVNMLILNFLEQEQNVTSRSRPAEPIPARPPDSRRTSRVHGVMGSQMSLKSIPANLGVQSWVV